MDADDVCGAEQLILPDTLDSELGGPFVGQVGAPRDHVHAKRLADPCHPGADVAEAEEPECLAVEVSADCLLPAAGANGPDLVGQPPGDGEDERPRQLDRVTDDAPGAGDHDAVVSRGPHIDRGVSQSGRDEQTEVGQPLEHRPRETGPLAHGDNDVEAAQRLDQLVLVTDMVGERDDLHAGRPLDDRRCDVLIVVEHRDTRHDASRRLMSSRSSPLAIFPPEARGRSSTTMRCSGQDFLGHPTLSQVGGELVEAEIRARRTQDDVHADPLAKQLVGRRDRGDEGDRGMAAHFVFDLSRAHVLPPRMMMSDARPTTVR